MSGAGVRIADVRAWAAELTDARIIRDGAEMSRMCGRAPSWLRCSRGDAVVGVDALVALCAALAARRGGTSGTVAVRIRGAAKGALMRLVPE